MTRWFKRLPQAATIAEVVDAAEGAIPVIHSCSGDAAYVGCVELIDIESKRLERAAAEFERLCWMVRETP